MQPVKMYTTAVCPYCIRAKQILKSKGVEQIEEIRIDTDPAARSHMMEITGRRTVPQIYIGDTHVGARGRVGVDADLLDLLHTFGFENLLGPHTVGADGGGVHLHGLHRGPCGVGLELE